MRAFATLVLLAVAFTMIGCGDSHNVTVLNECQETVNVQFTPSEGESVAIDGIESVAIDGIEAGQEQGGTIGFGPMDVKAIFPENGVEAVTGFKSEEGGEYRLVIRGNPPGIFLEVK